MFDIGWAEMAVIALIALVVIGPKELPNAMRAAAKWARKARSLAREFQSGVDDMVREADLEDARKAVDVTRNFDVGKAIEDTVDPTGEVQDEARDLDSKARDMDDVGDGSVEAETGGATIIEQPFNMAPPHSLTPPPDELAPKDPAPKESVESGGTSSSKKLADDDTPQKQA